MKPRQSLSIFVTAAMIYLFALVWVDHTRGLFSGISALESAFPSMLGASILSYFARAARWRLLLKHAGYRIPWPANLIIYISGFAFTATPGKSGELIRVKYLSNRGIPSSTTFAAFIFERMADLIVVLFLSSLFVGEHKIFLIAATFVFVVAACLILISTRPNLLANILSTPLIRRSRAASAAGSLFQDSLRQLPVWLQARVILQTLILGTVSWSMTSWAFLQVLSALGIAIPAHQAFSIYPMAMLAGAASMLPGGLGTTEAVIVTLLTICGAEPQNALVAAVGIRLTSLWFAIFLGFSCIALLECINRLRLQRPTQPQSHKKNNLTFNSSSRNTHD